MNHITLEARQSVASSGNQKIRSFTLRDFIDLLNLVFHIGDLNVASIFNFLVPFFSYNTLNNLGLESTVFRSISINFTSKTNVIIVSGEKKDFLIIFSKSGDRQKNTIPISIYDIKANHFYINFKGSDLIQSGILRDFLKEPSSRRSMNDILNQPFSKTKPKKCLLCFPSITHLGHNVMNTLGPLVYFVENYTNDEKYAPIELFISKNNVFTSRSHVKELVGDQFNVNFVENYEQVDEYSRQNRFASFQLNACIVPPSLSKKTRKYLSNSYSSPRELSSDNAITLAIGVRGGSRQAMNLQDVIHELCKQLRKNNMNIQFVIDGMSKSSFASSSKSTAEIDLDLEKRIAYDIHQLILDNNFQCDNIVGIPIEKQLNELKRCDLIVGHQGSLSAKYAWLLGVDTILHGPVNLSKIYQKSEICDDINDIDVGLNFIHAYRCFKRVPKEFLINFQNIINIEQQRTRWNRANYELSKESTVSQIIQIIKEEKFNKNKTK
ncbi:hypothetical protein OAZ24_03730 [Synechococcus sp. AH-736-G21]|nr:hypothetical protein [Synechococcus sp. AH-736-G21]